MPDAHPVHERLVLFFIWFLFATAGGRLAEGCFVRDFLFLCTS